MSEKMLRLKRERRTDEEMRGVCNLTALSLTRLLIEISPALNHFQNPTTTQGLQVVDDVWNQYRNGAVRNCVQKPDRTTKSSCKIAVENKDVSVGE
jgi:hypothetical protein